MREQELILYRNLAGADILRDMSRLMDHCAGRGSDGGMAGNGCGDDSAGASALFYHCIHGLLELAGSHGFYGNLWHCYLTDLLVNDENSYSMACEVTGAVAGTVNEAALHDFTIFREFFQFDLTAMAEVFQGGAVNLIRDYQIGERRSRVYNTRIRDHICALAVRLCGAESAAEMKEIMTDFYGAYGVGKLGLHKAFRVVHEGDEMEIRPIQNIAHGKLDDLIGYEIQKKKLIENTEAFVEVRRANNCLLFGDAGTGKSSSIKAIANAYYSRGLRIIEVYKHQFRDLSEIIARVKHRGYRFIIYMDDLSFEEFETEYKYLKAVIEGGLEKKPDNVLIYATSNRRHLVRERFSDREERSDDLHTNDTVQEKLSLASRFGVTIYFGSPDKKEFQNIVRGLADRQGIRMPTEELLAQANQWELAHGGLSGRCAQQFIDYLAGRSRR